MASNRLQVLITGSADGLNRALDEAQKKADSALGAIQKGSQEASIALGAMAASGGLLIQQFASKAGEMESFAVTIERVMGSASAGQAELKRLADFAAKTPFDLPGVVKAGISLRALGQDATKFLPLAGDLAAVFNRDIPDAALALGKALSGSQDGIQVLADSYGIARKEMAKFGAAIKSDGSIAVETAAEIEKLQGALEKIISSRYGGTMEKQSQTLNGLVSTLGDSVGQLSAQLGAELAPALKSGVQLLTKMVDSIAAMPPAAKSMAATAVVVTTVVAGLGTVVTGLIAVLGPAAASYVFLNQALRASAAAKAAAAAASTATAVAEAELAVAGTSAAVAQTGLAGAMRGLGAAMMANPIGLVVGALLALGAGAAYVISEMSRLTQAQEAQIAASERNLAHLREQKAVTVAVADAVKQWGNNTEQAAKQAKKALDELGATDLDITKAMAGNGEVLRRLYEQLAEAERKGEDGSRIMRQIRIYEQRNEVLRAERNTRRGSHDEKMRQIAESEAKEKKAAADREKLLEEYKKKSSKGYYETAQEQIAALDQVLAAIGKGHKDFADLTLDRVKLARQASRESVEAEMTALEEIQGAHEEAIKKRIAILQKFATDPRLSAKERRKVEIDLLKEQEALEKEQAKTQQQVLEAKRASHDQVARNLATELQAGKDLLGQLEAELKKRDQVADQLDRLRAKQEGRGKSAVDQAKLIAAAEEQIANRGKARELEVDKLRRTRDAEASKAKQKVMEAEKTAADVAIQELQRQVQAGAPVLEQLKEQVRVRTEIVDKLDQEKLKSELVGKSLREQSELRKAAETSRGARAKAEALELEKIERDAAARKMRDAQSESDLRAAEAQHQEQYLRAQLAAGAQVGQQLMQQIKARQSAELEILVAKAQASKVDKTAAEQAMIDRHLQMEVLELKRKQKAETREITEELKRQKAEQAGGLDLGGNPYSIDEFFRRQSEKAESKPVRDEEKLRDLRKDEQLSKSEAEAVTRNPGMTGEQAQEMIRLLAKIEASKPEVTVKTAGGQQLPTEQRDWRLSTNRPQGVL